MSEFYMQHSEVIWALGGVIFGSILANAFMIWVRTR
jgi:hypothetical protein